MGRDSTVAPVVPWSNPLSSSLARIPHATYRLQLNQSFTFRDATALVPYLHDLGISDCYASPILKARPGSNHGYDICDHGQLNPEIGSEEEFTRFAEALEQKGMGLLVDVVPNHMAIRDQANTWWFDVLENGPSSVYAQYFDIDWQPVKPELANRVLLPILEGQYGRVLEEGKLTLSYEDGAFYVSYYETKLPIAPGTYRQILGQRLDQVVATLGEGHEHAQELQSILTALSYLPEHTELSPEKIAERHREKEVIKRRIAALAEVSPAVRTAINDAIDVMNGRVGEPSTFDRLDDLLRDQAYRLAFWRVATEEINYRRFFDVNELAAIRVELPEVFQATHQLMFRFLSEGKITGLRVDHPDGLWDPPRYFRWLQDSYYRLSNPVDTNGKESGLAERPEGMAPPLYVVAEKILVEGENAPEGWEIYGTTGYDFLNTVNGLFVDGKNRVAFDRVYNDFTKLRLDYRNLVNSSKKMIMLISLASEINALSHQLERVAEANRWYRDFTLNSLTFAIREVIACLPVYRTYIVGQDGRLSEHDRACVETAVKEAQRRNPRTSETIFDFIRDTLLLRNLQDFREEYRPKVIDFVMTFQQITGPVMAKGVEDTAFYVYNRLVSLNEVGGNPEQFGVPTSVFHQQNATRAMRWPHSLLASSTHDTKRSEDVRARISVLSELPQEWRAALEHWSHLNRRKKTEVNGTPAPSTDDEYLLYQTLLGVWPFGQLAPGEFAEFRERIAAYMLKATKESKVQTSWVNPNAGYDEAVRNFVMRLLPDNPFDPFLVALQKFQRRIAFYGQFNALSQLLLKLTAPGVPDMYQGNELWDFSLVDPDNRRPVDYAPRRAALASLQARVQESDPNLVTLARDLLDNSGDGRIKLYVTYRALNFRRANPAIFQNGGYYPLQASGSTREHVVAYRRAVDNAAALVVVPRLVARLTEGVEQPPLDEPIWEDTRLTLPGSKPGDHWRNVFTGETLSVGGRSDAPSLGLGEILRNFPVALLEQSRSSR